MPRLIAAVRAWWSRSRAKHEDPLPRDLMDKLRSGLVEGKALRRRRSRRRMRLLRGDR